MTRIGLLSDTHGYLDEQVLHHFRDCDEIWHAGDVGPGGIVAQLQAAKPFRGVYGNIDGPDVSEDCPEHQRFELDGVRVWMTHIGGTPPRYNPAVRPWLQRDPPDVFICGHSHILKIARDPTLRNLLYVNPGAAGRSGFHIMRTCVRFALDAGRVLNMEVIELGKRAGGANLAG
jgi:uncharacterized protein